MASSEPTCLLFCKFLAVILLFVVHFLHPTSSATNQFTARNETDFELQKPTIFVAILIRNKAHSLPWFFGHLENLDYPKDRIALWIRSDHNIDNSTSKVKEWLNGTEHMYNYVDFVFDDAERAYSDEKGPCDWSKQRFDHVIGLRQQALQTARELWADYLLSSRPSPSSYEKAIHGRLVGPTLSTPRGDKYYNQYRPLCEVCPRDCGKVVGTLQGCNLMIDADVMLENPDTLNLLIEQQKTIISPMLNASIGETYSNFWGGMDEEGYYKRVPEYFDIVERKTYGCFQVPMVHTVLLINLRHKISQKLAYTSPEGYSKPEDDIILFAQSALTAGIPMHVLNTEYFGQVMIPLDWHHNIHLEEEQFLYMRNEALDYDNPDMSPGIDYIVEGRGFRPSPHIILPVRPKDKLGFDQVYMINLERRPERRIRMQWVFDLLGIDAEHIPAVDGRQLNDSFLVKQGITMLEGYSDPYHGRLLNDTYLSKLDIRTLPGFADPYGGRPMTMGEIGCFLSHYYIWKDVLEKKYKSVVVFEDDLRLEPYFRTKLKNIMEEVAFRVPDWDLIYLGRKRLNVNDEAYVKGSKTLAWPSYSYWTLSYLLSYKGAEKLMAQKPLQKMIPVDEYLPIMFDQHPETAWKEAYYPRDLVSLSAEPLLIYPTHYLGEPNYISDTEDSKVISAGSGEEVSHDDTHHINQNLETSDAAEDSQSHEEL